MVILLPFTGISATGADAIFVAGGYQGNGLLGSGDVDNKFDLGNGFSLELGLYNRESNVGWVFLGFRYSTNLNHVRSSVAHATFLVPYYTEIRFYTHTDPVRVFFFFGFDWNRMHFDNASGSDNQYLLTGGLGLHGDLMGPFLVQLKAKPYYVFGNSLGQKYGVSAEASVGIWLTKASSD